MKFSASQLKAWQGCALRASFIYVDKMDRYSVGSSAHFGTCVHLALENFHNGVDLDSCIQIFRDAYDEIEPDYYNQRTSRSRFLDMGPKMISDYADSVSWEDHITLGSEFRFMVPFGSHTISGIVDHLHVSSNGKTVYVDDLKTGKRPNMDSLHLDLQMTSYDWAIRQREFWVGVESDDPDWPDKYCGLSNGDELFEKYKDAEIVVRWVDLKKPEFVNVGKRDEFDYARLYRMMEMIDRAVETKTFVPCISADTCKFCEFKDICPVWVDPPVRVSDFEESTGKEEW